MDRHELSLMDEDDLDTMTEYCYFRELLKNVYDNQLDPQPFCDAMGKEVKELDAVIYADKDWGPRPGIVVKIDPSGDFCAVSYIGDGEDCKNLAGEMVCKDLIYKCLKVSPEDIIKIYG